MAVFSSELVKSRAKSDFVRDIPDISRKISKQIACAEIKAAEGPSVCNRGSASCSHTLQLISTFCRTVRILRDSREWMIASRWVYDKVTAIDVSTRLSRWHDGMTRAHVAAEWTFPEANGRLIGDSRSPFERSNGLNRNLCSMLCMCVI